MPKRNATVGVLLVISMDYNYQNRPKPADGADFSGKRIIAIASLVAALGLIIYPPCYSGHRAIWELRGRTVDWGRLALELCLLAIIGALGWFIAPIVESWSRQSVNRSLRRAGLALLFAAILMVAVAAAYRGILYVAQWRKYELKLQEFQAKTSLLREAFPLGLPSLPAPNEADWIPLYSITNVHEAEFVLRGAGWDDADIQRAMARFLSESAVPNPHKAKSLDFSGSADVDPAGPNSVKTKTSGDIFDQVGTKTPMWKRDKRASAAFEFYIRDGDAAKRFFAPLPDWYAEALKQNIEVSRVPEWMKPGEPPASFAERLDWGNLWIVPAVPTFVLGVLCFIAARRV